MNSKEFKSKYFNKIALKYDFKKSFGSWIKESDECLIILDLQKSNYGDYYQFLIKIFIKGLFDKTYKVNKNLINNNAPIMIGPPLKEQKIFDFDTHIDDDIRLQQTERFFQKYIIPITSKALTIEKLKTLIREMDIVLLPNVRKELKM